MNYVLNSLLHVAFEYPGAFLAEYSKIEIIWNCKHYRRKLGVLLLFVLIMVIIIIVIIIIKLHFKWAIKPYQNVLLLHLCRVSVLHDISFVLQVKWWMTDDLDKW